ncbi:MAG: two-component system response regulator [Comamonadaceae bacterium]|nr:two-component system response regulator [Comamonadaceae bacterium]
MCMDNVGKKKTVLVVDDVPENIAIANSVLKDSYKVQTALDGATALDLVLGARRRPDLILLDIQMPGMDGYEVCRRLKNDPKSRSIPVIFLTALADQMDEARGFVAGAVDYIHKPFSPAIVRARVATHLSLKEAHDQLENQNQMLEEKVKDRTAEIALVQGVTIGAMAALAEARDNETGNHINRTQRYVERLAWSLRSHTRFAKLLTPQVIESLYRSAPLHDIGKVGVPDRILLKPGSLDAQEFEIMKSHASIGAVAIARAERDLGSSGNSFLRYAHQIALHHHEKWDGSGYPHGLSGDAIPLSARLMALADVYDALISKRVYKPAFSHEKAVTIITTGRGQHFDPDIVDRFVAIQDEFQKIAHSFQDEDDVRPGPMAG